ncbi:N-ATPase subunit AtpR [Bradyrhizobium guangxiense]|jgi:hypothetical protein
MSGSILYNSLAVAVASSGWFVAGSLLGLAHFGSLRWVTRWMLGGRALLSIGLQGLRFIATAGTLTLLAFWFGALPLLTGTIGLLAARTGLLLLEPRQ